MRLSSFPLIGLQGILSADKPPVWALSILEDTAAQLEQDGSPAGKAYLEKEIRRIELDLASRFAS